MNGRKKSSRLKSFAGPSSTSLPRKLFIQTQVQTPIDSFRYGDLDVDMQLVRLEIFKEEPSLARCMCEVTCHNHHHEQHKFRCHTYLSSTEFEYFRPCLDIQKIIFDLFMLQVKDLLHEACDCPLKALTNPNREVRTVAKLIVNK